MRDESQQKGRRRCCDGDGKSVVGSFKAAQATIAPGTVFQQSPRLMRRQTGQSQDDEETNDKTLPLFPCLRSTEKSASGVSSGAGQGWACISTRILEGFFGGSDKRGCRTIAPTLRPIGSANGEGFHWLTLNCKFS